MIPRLKELYENKMLMEDYCPTGVMTATNVDDIFKGLSANEIKEVCVDREEMIMITMFMVCQQYEEL